MLEHYCVLTCLLVASTAVTLHFYRKSATKQGSWRLAPFQSEPKHSHREFRTHNNCFRERRSNPLDHVTAWIFQLWRWCFIIANGNRRAEKKFIWLCNVKLHDNKISPCYSVLVIFWWSFESHRFKVHLVHVNIDVAIINFFHYLIISLTLRLQCMKRKGFKKQLLSNRPVEF